MGVFLLTGRYSIHHNYLFFGGNIWFFTVDRQSTRWWCIGLAFSLLVAARCLGLMWLTLWLWGGRIIFDNRKGWQGRLSINFGLWFHIIESLFSFVFDFIKLLQSIFCLLIACMIRLRPSSEILFLLEFLIKDATVGDLRPRDVIFRWFLNHRCFFFEV